MYISTTLSSRFSPLPLTASLGFSRADVLHLGRDCWLTSKSFGENAWVSTTTGLWVVVTEMIMGWWYFLYGYNKVMHKSLADQGFCTHTNWVKLTHLLGQNLLWWSLARFDYLCCTCLIWVSSTSHLYYNFGFRTSSLGEFVHTLQCLCRQACVLSLTDDLPTL